MKIVSCFPQRKRNPLLAWHCFQPTNNTDRLKRLRALLTIVIVLNLVTKDSYTF